MNAGRLNQRISIESLVESQDEIGEPIVTWEVFAELWADVVDMTGREYMAANAPQSIAQTKIYIRYYPGIKPAMRVVHETNIYDVESVLGQDKKTLVLMCKRTES